MENSKTKKWKSEKETTVGWKYSLVSCKFFLQNVLFQGSRNFGACLKKIFSSSQHRCFFQVSPPPLQTWQEFSNQDSLLRKLFSKRQHSQIKLNRNLRAGSILSLELRIHFRQRSKPTTSLTERTTSKISRSLISSIFFKIKKYRARGVLLNEKSKTECFYTDNLV